MSSEAANLRVICEAMDRHDRNCGAPLLEIRLNPFEEERLGWDDIRGVPVKADDEVDTGRFKLVCTGSHSKDAPSVEAVAGQGVAA